MKGKTEYKHLLAAVPAVVTIFITLFAAGAATAQNSSASPNIASGASAIQLDRLVGAGTAQGSLTDGSDLVPIRRITLEQVKQAAADPITSPLKRLGQLELEAAKQHRLGVQADYFPKFGFTFVNLHMTDFLGQILEVRRPIQGLTTQVPVALINQNTTIAALTFTQPITPLFIVHHAVKIARADERIAMAKFGVSVTRKQRETEIEEVYFKLLIAKRRLTSTEVKLRNRQNLTQYASAHVNLMHARDQEPELMEARKAMETAAVDVKKLTGSLNAAMEWPVETELELAFPEPLVEGLSLEEVSDKSAAANLDVIEAEQNVVKARAASMISKLEYVPTVAAVSGYLFQNLLPSVRSNFGYGGVMASYTLFDFGKRERAVNEARAKVGMAEIALQLTKAKIGADVKKSYFELERSRQLSQMAQKMGSSMALLMNVSSNPESVEVQAARAEVEVEMLEADLAHRQDICSPESLDGPVAVEPNLVRQESHV